MIVRNVAADERKLNDTAKKKKKKTLSRPCLTCCKYSKPLPLVEISLLIILLNIQKVVITSFRHRCDVLTSQRCRNDVITTLYVEKMVSKCWVFTGILDNCNVNINMCSLYQQKQALWVLITAFSRQSNAFHIITTKLSSCSVHTNLTCAYSCRVHCLDIYLLFRVFIF